MYTLLKNMQEEIEEKQHAEYKDDVDALSEKLALAAKPILKKQGKDGNVTSILNKVATDLNIASSMVDDCIRNAKRILAGKNK